MKKSWQSIFLQWLHLAARVVQIAHQQADAAMSFNLHATSSASNRSKGPTLKWYLRLVLRLHGSNTQSRCKPVTKYIFWYKALFTSMDLTAPSTHPPLLSSRTTHY